MFQGPLSFQNIDSMYLPCLLGEWVRPHTISPAALPPREGFSRSDGGVFELTYATLFDRSESVLGQEVEMGGNAGQGPVSSEIIQVRGE